MENKSRLKIILGIVVALVIFITSFWLLLYSSVTANNSFVIKARNFYYLRLLPVWGFDQRDLTYTIFPSQKDTKYGYYTYTLLGKFEKFDFDNHLIYLKNKNGQTYAFKYFVKKTTNSPNLTFITYQDFVNQKPTTNSYIEFNSDKPGEVDSMFVVGDVIEIQWEDFRTLNQILAEGKKGSEILIERDEVLGGVTQVVNRYLYEN